MKQLGEDHGVRYLVELEPHRSEEPQVEEGVVGYYGCLGEAGEEP
jgi:hypothetical protein